MGEREVLEGFLAGFRKRWTCKYACAELLVKKYLKNPSEVCGYEEFANEWRGGKSSCQRAHSSGDMANQAEITSIL